MSAANRTALDAIALRQRLASLRRRHYYVTLARGAGVLLTFFLFRIIVCGVSDWFTDSPGIIRAVQLVLTLVFLGIVALEIVVRPLRMKADDLSLALRIEERYPWLNDALASTVQFLDAAPNRHDSTSMRTEAIRRALGLVQGLDLKRVVSSRGVFGSLVLASLMAAVGLVLVWTDPARATTALVRFANPFGSTDWPRMTNLAALEARHKTMNSPTFTSWLPLTSAKTDSAKRIGKNYEFQIQGVVTGRVIPEKVAVIFLHDNFPASEHTCEVTLDPATNTHRFSTRLKPDQVQRSFSFFIRANDTTSERFEIVVVEPPKLVPLEGQPSPQLALHYPQYTDLPASHPLPPGTGNVEAVAGTVVTLRAKADRPLRAAWIEFLPEDRSTFLGSILTSFGASQPLDSAALTAAGQTVWDRVPAQLESDPSQFSVRFLPRVHGNYLLHFEDDTGLRNSRTFELRLRSDPTPVVQLLRPSASHDILQVLPGADMTLHVVAEDSTFALRSVFVLYRTLRTDPPRVLPLYDHATFVGNCVAPLTGPAVRAAKQWHLRPTNLEFRRTLSLKTIQHLNGWSLREGDVVILQAGADDFDDVAPSKPFGLSHEIEIRIVGRNALEIELNREQAKVQQDLLRLREKEREALKAVTEVENKLKRGDKLTEDDLAKLLQAEQTQQQIHERIGDDKEGLRAEVERILQTLKQNQLQNSAVKDRMQDVQRELDRVAEEELPPIEQRLAEARRQAELSDEKTRAERKAALEKQQQELTERSLAAAKEAAAKLEQARQNEQDAPRLKKEAAELQQKAEQLRQQAERARRDAENGGAQPRELLGEARQHQEEVEKTLNDLLQRLEPWSSSREVKGEANKLLEEQRQLQAQLEELKTREKNLLGKPREELLPRQLAELAELRDAQQRLEERTNQLLEKMDRLAQERADKDPETAKELQDARQQARDANITGQMRDARENITNNRIQEAQQKQDAAIKGLQKMVKSMEDRREAELDRLVKKLREAEKELEELAVEQEQLQKKVKDAQNLADPMAREEALKKLTKQQKDLQQKTQEMMKQLSRLRAERASSALGRAGDEMEQAGDELSRGKKGDEKQDDALDRIDEAQRELERARQQAEEELRREQLARVEDTIKRLRDRQVTLTTDAVRIQKEIQQKAEWTRALNSELSRLAENEKGLGSEAADVAKKELGSTPVFAKLVKNTAITMEDAAKRIDTLKQEQKEQPAFDKLPDAELKGLQDEAVRRLNQMLDAIKAEASALARNSGSSGGGGNGGGDEGAAGGNRGPEGLPPLAQLKLLRAMQEDVNKRTEAFRKAHPDLDKLTEKEKTELAGIRRDQQDIATLLEELRNAGEPGGPEGEKP